MTFHMCVYVCFEDWHEKIKFLKTNQFPSLRLAPQLIYDSRTPLSAVPYALRRGNVNMNEGLAVVPR